ncbi:sigma-70 family RNA polymerase sigma factor [Pseudorhodoferax sp.]|uniref:sigma-70 family RNA polymerase sigma factor n=1 Tax=Pseudorhodoferax sp. TaxID=1993553 RepID=UPI0039E4C2DB
MDAIYREHHAWLLQLLRRKLGCCDRAADLAHDTFERLLRQQGQVLPALREPRAYLRSVAQHLAVSHYRRQAVEQAYLQAVAALPEDCVPSPETQLAIVEAVQAVSRILDGLNDRTRRIFLLSRLDGLSHAEIAQALGISPKAVQKAVSRALQHCYVAVYEHA